MKSSMILLAKGAKGQKHHQKPSAQSSVKNVEIFRLKELSLMQGGAGTCARTCASSS